MPDIEQVILPDNVTYDIRDTSKLATSLKGAANGVAELDINGIVPESQLPTLEKSASGSLVSFSDGGDNIPLGSLIANITAVQSGSGTPSPSNVRAISGWSGANVSRTGKNLFNSSTIYENKAIVWATGLLGDETGSYASDYIPVIEGQTYRCNKLISQLLAFDRNRTYVYVYRSGSWLSPQTGLSVNSSFTIPSGISYIRITRRSVDMSGATIAEDSSSLQLEVGSTATTYEPFGTQVTIPFGQTVYGGTLNVIKGLLTVTHKQISIDNNSTLYSSGNSAYVAISDAKIVNEYCNAISDKYQYSTWYDATNNNNTYFTLYKNLSWTGGSRLAFNRNGATLEDFKTSLTNNPISVVYELATPVTYQLTPVQVRTLLGLNNIFADTGDVSLSYFTQNAKPISDLSDANKQDVLATDVPKTDLTDIFVTGTKNNTGSIIPANKFFYLNGELVVCKQAIGSGADLTLNTNYVKVTAGVLNGLYNVLQTVTPTSSDKLLVVQSQGQGLASWGSKLDSANPTGTGKLSMNRKSGSAEGAYSATEGYNNTASGDRSHAEGSVVTSSGYAAHAEGAATTASGNSSHAEGNSANASGNFSHAEGFETIANHKSQHVFGEYNLADGTENATSRGNYVEIVGKGTSDNARSNARTLDWSGNETIAGTLTQSSDAKLKDIINEELPDVSSIKAVKFKWKENANRDESEHIGYTAQDVEKVLPYLVKEDAEGNKVLDYIAFLVAKVDSLEKRLAELEK